MSTLLGIRKLYFFCLAFIFFSVYHKGYGENTDTSYINQLIVKAVALENTYPDSTYLLAQRILKLSETDNYEKGIASACMRLGSVLNKQGENDSAFYFTHKAYELRKKLKNYHGAIGACYTMCYIYVRTGKIDSAFAVLYEAINLNKYSNDSSDWANIYIELGNLSAQYNVKDAMKYFLLANEISGKLKNNKLTLRVNSGIATYFFSIKDFKQSLIYFLKADSIIRKQNDEIAFAKSLNNIALCYDQLKDYNKATEFYLNALNGYVKLRLRNDEALVCFNIASMYNNRKIPDSAIFYLNRSLDIALQINDRKRVADCYEYLSDAYALKMDYKKAYEYHLNSTLLNDSLLNAEKISSISEMQTKYETEKKEHQIGLLDEQNRTKSAQRNFFIAGSIVLLLGLFVLGFYYVQRNRIAKKNEQLSEQKISSLLNEQEIKSYNAMIDGQEEERKRIASDLHDRLGSMLATVKLLFNGLNTKNDSVQEENKKQYESASNLLDEAVVEVRRISHNLSTGMVISFGLVPALQELCESIDSSNLIRCKLLTYGMKNQIDQQTEIGIYRIVQELFSNILKHAKAKNVTIQLNQTEGSLNLTIEDDGVGFDVEEKKKSGGMGLNNLQARATKLNGVYHVDSSPGKGTISIIEIPISKTEL